MNDREFWIQIRRGLIVMIDAIDHRFALPTVRSSAPASLHAQPESPPGAVAQSSQEGISVNGVRNR